MMPRWHCALEYCRWHLEQVTAPDVQPLSVPFVRDDHLKLASVADGRSPEDGYVGRLIAVSTRQAERVTERALISQQWSLVLDRFPTCAGPIILPKPPLLSIDAFTYVDGDGVTQSLSGSPTTYQLKRPTGPNATYAELWPPINDVWPVTQCGLLEAVTITFTCGYGDPDDIPEDIGHGQLLMIGELYKQRSESVHAPNQNPAYIRARDLWLQYKAF